MLLLYDGAPNLPIEEKQFLINGKCSPDLSGSNVLFQAATVFTMTGEPANSVAKDYDRLFEEAIQYGKAK